MGAVIGWIGLAFAGFQRGVSQKLIDDGKVRVQNGFVFELPCRVDEFRKVFEALFSLFPAFLSVMIQESRSGQ